MGLDLARLWLVESDLWATEIGAGLVNNRTTTHATVLMNERATPFITGDQPVINLQPQTDLKSVFYYPIAPQIALRLSTMRKDCEVKSQPVTQIEAERLSHDIYRWSEDQLYGVDGKYLEEISAVSKTLIS